MTQRLYYTDAYAREFDATVLDLVSLDDGRLAAILDRTAFYPASGGQPCDTGTLGSAPVVDVIDREDGAVLHVIDGTVAAAGVHGQIDWDRRFEHMQQHTGQHVLSAAFERACRARTESFHLGSASATIDLSPEVSPRQIDAAELEANRIVWENRPVHVRFVDAREAASLVLRKEPVKTGMLRLVEVEGFDLSACGGTHVARTGAIGNISVAASERFRGGTRLEFRCGIRTLQACRALRDTVASASQLLSTGAAGLPGAIDRLQADNKEIRRRLKHLQEQLAQHEAAALLLHARPVGTASIVFKALDGWDAAGLKSIAGAIAERSRHAAVLAGGQPAAIVIARAADVALDASAVVKALTGRFGGKGGGRSDLAQGGGLNASAADVVAYARTLV